MNQTNENDFGNWKSKELTSEMTSTDGMFAAAMHAHPEFRHVDTAIESFDMSKVFVFSDNRYFRQSIAALR